MYYLLLLCFLLPSDAYVVIPYYPPVSYLYPQTLFHQPLVPVSQPLLRSDVSFSTLEPGQRFSPVRKNPVTQEEAKDESKPIPTARIAGGNLDICYFLGNDIFTSHVPCNPNWGDGTNDGVKRYINELTFETNRMLGEQNMKLTWKGPFERHDSRTSAAPSNPSHDVQSVVGYGCDAVVFLVFNKFSSDCETQTYGHEFGGYSLGGMCEQAQGRGFSVIVDQGFLEDAWTGPQILAHHLLLMLTSDLRDSSKTCPSKESLLHPKLYPGQQRVDQCVVDKLNRSQVSNRQCMRN